MTDYRPLISSLNRFKLAYSVHKFSERMIKSELIQAMASRHPNLPVKRIAQGVNLILSTMSEALAQKRRIEVRGFGSFALHFHAPRKARNPKTGEWLLTKGKYVARFKMGKLLKQEVNEER